MTSSSPSDAATIAGCRSSPIPRVDFANLYDAEYYAGRGADSFVDYVDEMQNPRTVREYEWRGITRHRRRV